MNRQIKIGNIEINSRVMLSPLAGITDYVFRKLARKYSKDVLLSTEMISSEALVQRPDCNLIKVCDNESPVLFQLSGHKPDIMSKAAKILESRADIIDINMGCPVNKVVKGQDGSALMRNPQLACDIVKAIKDTVSIPVSAKFRLGWSREEINCVEFAKKLEEAGVDSICIHGRTRVQMYSGEASWDEIGLVKKEVKIPVFANGDVVDETSAKKCLDICNADGLAIGRATLGDIEILNRIDFFLKTGEMLPRVTIDRKIDLLIEHLNEEIEFRGIENGIKFMRKFFAYYIKGVKAAAKYRGKLVVSENYNEIIEILEEIRHNEQEVLYVYNSNRE